MKPRIKTSPFSRSASAPRLAGALFVIVVVVFLVLRSGIAAHGFRPSSVPQVQSCACGPAVAGCVQPTDPRFYYLPRDYFQRFNNSYDPEPAGAEKVMSWQYKVYETAGHLARKTKAPRIIDVGCGSGVKLAELREFTKELICIDFGENLRGVVSLFPFIKPIEVDLNTDVATLLASETLRDAIVINADNIEHIVDAEKLIGAFRVWMQHAAALLISTPDREQHGHSALGPPPNRAHVREWSLCEFVHFFSRYGPRLFAAGWTENNNVGKAHITLFVVAVRDDLVPTISLPPGSYKPWTTPEALSCIARMQS